VSAINLSVVRRQPIPTLARPRLGGRRRNVLDEVAIREFLHTTYPRLVAAITLVSGSRAAAEDAVQEGLLRAWERSERGERIDSLPAWVATVALNHARSALRRLRSERKARARLKADAVGRSPGSSAERVDIVRALAALPRRRREVVVLRYYLGMSTKEVATVLAIDEGTVKSTLFRGRATLADALGVHDLEEANDRGTA
jgi:RNA polymerase sigma-70 factor (ECF subfamily)